MISPVGLLYLVWSVSVHTSCVLLVRVLAFFIFPLRKSIGNQYRVAALGDVSSRSRQKTSRVHTVHTPIFIITTFEKNFGKLRKTAENKENPWTGRNTMRVYHMWLLTDLCRVGSKSTHPHSLPKSARLACSSFLRKQGTERHTHLVTSVYSPISY